MKRWVFLVVLVLSLGASAWAQQPDTRPHASNMRFNKLRAGSLGNCGTNNFVTGFNPQTGTPVCVQPNSSMLSDATDLVKRMTPEKVSNKQNVPREVTLVPSGGAITPPCDDADVVVVNAIAGPLTVNAPAPCTGTNPEPSQEIDFRFFCSAARPIFWAGAYSETAGVPYLNTCSGNGNYDYAKVRRNSVNNSWEFLAIRATGRGVATFASANEILCDAGTAVQCVMRNTAVTNLGILLKNPGGSPVDGQLLLWVLRCASPQTLTYESQFIDSPGITRPSACSTDTQKYTMVGARFSSSDTLWQIISVIP